MKLNNFNQKNINYPRYIALFFLTLAAVAISFYMFVFLSEDDLAKQDRIALMEMIQSLSPVKKYLVECKKENINCSELDEMLHANSGHMGRYYFKEDSSLYGVDFKRDALIRLVYDVKNDNWSCEGAPQKALIDKCELIGIRSKK